MQKLITVFDDSWLISGEYFFHQMSGRVVYLFFLTARKRNKQIHLFQCGSINQTVHFISPGNLLPDFMYNHIIIKKMCSIHFTNNIKILILVDLWKKLIIQVFISSWTAIPKSLCFVELIMFFKKKKKLVFFAHTTEYYWAFSKQQRSETQQAGRLHHCFWRGHEERCRAIYVTVPQNSSGIKNADITSGIPFTSARAMHVFIWGQTSGLL